MRLAREYLRQKRRGPVAAHKARPVNMLPVLIDRFDTLMASGDNQAADATARAIQELEGWGCREKRRRKAKRKGCGCGK